MDQSYSPRRQNRSTGSHKRYMTGNDEAPKSQEELEAQRQRYLKLMFSLKVATCSKKDLQPAARPAAEGVGPSFAQVVASTLDQGDKNGGAPGG